jgi:hypothetical protein
MAVRFIFDIPSRLLIANITLSAEKPRCSEQIGSPRRHVDKTKH